MGVIKRFFQSKNLYIVLRVIVALSLCLFVVGLIINKDQQLRSQYIFNIVQCSAFLVVSILPYLIKKMNVIVPDYFYVIFILFCWAHFICGEVRGFYVNVTGWDSILHALSGGLISLGCFSFINLLNDNNIVHINKFMVVLSAFTLTVTIGVVWEIVEFGIDGIFGTNMQRAYNSISGEAFIGRKALIDTMKDLILDICGALFVCTICGVIIKKRGKVPKLLMSYKIKKSNLNDAQSVTALNESLVEEKISKDATNQDGETSNGDGSLKTIETKEKLK